MKHVIGKVAVASALVLTASTGQALAQPGIAPYAPPTTVRIVVGAATICQNGERDEVRRPHEPAYFVRDADWLGPGTMCLRSDGLPDFRVSSASRPDPKGRVHAYPSIGAGCMWGHCTPDGRFPVRVRKIAQLTSTVHTVGIHNPGVFNGAYDIWSYKNCAKASTVAHPDQTELMIWNYAPGAWRPANSRLVTIDGVRFWRNEATVYDHSPDQRFGGMSFHWKYLAYHRVWNGPDIHVNIRHFINNAESIHALYPSSCISAASYGFEVHKNGLGLGVSSFRLHLVKR